MVPYAKTYPARPLDDGAMARCQARWDGVAKPLNGLGQLERIIRRIAGLTGTDDVTIDKRSVLVFCADNGVVREGVTQADASVTASVARSIARGTGNICQMSRIARAKVIPVDVGMLSEADEPNVLNRKIRRGTGDICLGPAMSRADAQEMIQVGIDLVRERKAKGDQLIVTGEMGIGNTTTSSAVAAVLLGADVPRVTGRGAGLSDSALRRKIAVIERAIERNRPDPGDALDVLCKLGGFDIAAMAGAFLGGAMEGVPVLIDGFISSISALIAQRICPAAKNAMFATHASREPAGRMVLDALGLSGIVYADMALGEGTGAVTVLPMLDMALAVYRSGGTFDDIKVAAYQHFSEGT